MSKFALVSTVDTMGDGFPGHCVMLFETKEAAIQHAVDLILQHDKSIEANECRWIGAEHWESAKKFLEDWQFMTLHPTEYFHVMPVADLNGKTAATA